MKTTNPIAWKAHSLDSGEIIEGSTLTTDGCGNYGISFMSRVQCALSHSEGYPIKPDTVYWQCGECKEWNHRKEIKCKGCEAVLYMCK